jgi:hypothetical protein
MAVAVAAAAWVPAAPYTYKMGRSQSIGVPLIPITPSVVTGATAYLEEEAAWEVPAEMATAAYKEVPAAAVVPLGARVGMASVVAVAVEVVALFFPEEMGPAVLVDQAGCTAAEVGAMMIAMAMRPSVLEAAVAGQAATGREATRTAGMAIMAAVAVALLVARAVPEDSAVAEGARSMHLQVTVDQEATVASGVEVARAARPETAARLGAMATR